MDLSPLLRLTPLAACGLILTGCPDSVPANPDGWAVDAGLRLDAAADASVDAGAAEPTYRLLGVREGGGAGEIVVELFDPPAVREVARIPAESAIPLLSSPSGEYIAVSPPGETTGVEERLHIIHVADGAPVALTWPATATQCGVPGARAALGWRVESGAESLIVVCPAPAGAGETVLRVTLDGDVEALPTSAGCRTQLVRGTLLRTCADGLHTVEADGTEIAAFEAQPFTVFTTLLSPTEMAAIGEDGVCRKYGPAGTTDGHAWPTGDADGAILTGEIAPHGELAWSLIHGAGTTLELRVYDPWTGAGADIVRCVLPDERFGLGFGVEWSPDPTQALITCDDRLSSLDVPSGASTELAALDADTDALSGSFGQDASRVLIRRLGVGADRYSVFDLDAGAASPAWAPGVGPDLVQWLLPARR